MMGTAKIISLYTGAGGLDVGLEAAGFDTAVAVEFDPRAVDTLRANRDWPVVPGDIHSEAAVSARLLELGRLREGDADLLVGGPPCQPFSKSGYWARGDARRLEDPRATTLEAYLRVLRDTKPKAFLLENVPGLAFSGKSEGMHLLQQTIESINREVGTNYSFTPALLNAADFGVPQLRQRVFIVGHRDGHTFRFPEPTHQPAADGNSLGDLLVEPYLSAWDAIGDLERDDDPSLQVSGKWADLLPSIPEGENYLFHTERGGGLPLFGWRRRYWSFLLKLAKRLPAWTIAAQPGPAIGPFHWRSRKLSVRELCRLQTFPEGFRIIGSRADAQRQLGNAVPSALAERLGLEIKAQFFGESAAARRPASLLPSRRSDMPDPEPVAAVPNQYHKLAGAHEAHPGTGRGYAALRRVAE
jgi:DNA (cytosine-5)-methyltransferase 1